MISCAHKNYKYTYSSTSELRSSTSELRSSTFELDSSASELRSSISELDSSALKTGFVKVGHRCVSLRRNTPYENC
ncbi:hypothetical protein [Nostoc sp.]|uniref:hypothetical protein n=1 Tax=Nostoc sp. TaxID=1180 RepID=UPI002FFC53A4